MTVTTQPLGESRRKASTLVGSFSAPILGRAARDALVKLDPRHLSGNPVILATEIVAVLAIAGSLAAKPKLGATAGTFPTDGPLFAGLLIGVILIMGGLQFFPALALGPIVEHFQMLQVAVR